MRLFALLVRIDIRMDPIDTFMLLALEKARAKRIPFKRVAP